MIHMPDGHVAEKREVSHPLIAYFRETGQENFSVALSSVMLSSCLVELAASLIVLL